ncbi:carbohydrate kinase [Seonamhaeicola sp.]|uniref:carbohydrate kinase family protein n=1 Tax=Seonamhaeicola sp. TaxID=1912245 RepID=UPI0026016B8D|nr:carbohydrate kinase [Seonamhaeicola sp.]
MMKIPKVVCYGEVLFDKLPTVKKIGGAPLNVALRMNSLGCQTQLISSVGADQDGKEIIDYLNALNFPTKFIQPNKHYPTGEAKVSLDDKGNASYEIKHPVAWDEILLNQNITTLVSQSDALIFGTLSNRDETSRATLLELLQHTKYSILDLNLRAPHYEPSTLKELMFNADLIKFSDEEFDEITSLYKSTYNSTELNVQYISQITKTKSICITMGAKGALLFYDAKFYYCKGYDITVVDTVGAGDSFLAGLVTQLLQNHNDPQYALNFACATGAMVAQNSGPNPKIKIQDIIDLMST